MPPATRSKLLRWMIAAAMIIAVIVVSVVSRVVVQSGRRWEAAQAAAVSLPEEPRDDVSAADPGHEPGSAGESELAAQSAAASAGGATQLRELLAPFAEVAEIPRGSVTAAAPAPGSVLDSNALVKISSRWLLTVREAQDERLPDAPAELVAWMDENADRMEEVASAVSAAAPPELDLLVREDPGPLEHALRVLTAVACADASRGDHARAARMLEAAWILNERLGAGPRTLVDPRFLLGALRVVRVEDRARWFERLDALDLRADRVDAEAAYARKLLRTADSRAQQGIPHEAPDMLRFLMVAVHTVPARWEAAADADDAMKTRERLLAAPACGDLVEQFPPDWRRDEARSSWRPVKNLNVARNLAFVAMEERDLLLTREVIARREEPALQPAGCPRPADLEVSTTPEGRTTIAWAADFPLPVFDAGRTWYRGDRLTTALRSFTFTPTQTLAPASASAP